jgi:hypothetical protein
MPSAMSLGRDNRIARRVVAFQFIDIAQLAP